MAMMAEVNVDFRSAGVSIVASAVARTKYACIGIVSESRRHRVREKYQNLAMRSLGYSRTGRDRPTVG